MSQSAAEGQARLTGYDRRMARAHARKALVLKLYAQGLSLDAIASRARCSAKWAKRLTAAHRPPFVSLAERIREADAAGVSPDDIPTLIGCSRRRVVAVLPLGKRRALRTRERAVALERLRQRVREAPADGVTDEWPELLRELALLLGPATAEALVQAVGGTETRIPERLQRQAEHHLWREVLNDEQWAAVCSVYGGKRLNLPRGVYRVLSKRQVFELHDAGLTNREIALRARCGERYVRRILSQVGLSGWGLSRLTGERVIKLHAAGKTVPDIAELVHRAPRTVTKWLRAAGLLAPARSRQKRCE